MNNNRWEPLCSFLDVPPSDCPVDTPFPRVNQRGDMVQLRQVATIIGTFYPVLLLLPLLLLWAIARCCKGSQGASAAIVAKKQR